MVGAKIVDMKLATKHGNDLRGMLKSIDADEVQVIVAS